jgi:Transposase DDE domain
MPELLWLYLTALLYDRMSATCMALAETLQTVAHDRLTRLLQANWSGPTLLELAFRTLFGWERGYLIIDATVIPKPFATAMENLACVYSIQACKPVYGFSLVLLIWTDGTCRIPVGIRLWHKGGPSKSALALEWLSYARNRLRCRPEDVLFDAWYPSTALLKRMRDYRWDLVCRLKKNRRFNGQALRAYGRHPYWAETGQLTGGLKVLVVRDGAQDFATNRLTLPAVEVRPLYRVRTPSEEVISVCKDQRGLTGCQARSERAQQHHFTCCLVACCVLERERPDRRLTIYQLKRHLSCQGRTVSLPALERLSQIA